MFLLLTSSPKYWSRLLEANSIANQFKNLLIPKIAFVVYRTAGLFHFFFFSIANLFYFRFSTSKIKLIIFAPKYIPLSLFSPIHPSQKPANYSQLLSLSSTCINDHKILLFLFRNTLKSLPMSPCHCCNSPVIPWLNLYNILPNDVPDSYFISFSFSAFSKTQTWMCLVTQSCPPLCSPIGCSPSGSSVRGDSPGKNTGVGCHVLLEGIFPTQGLNPDFLHCRQIFYCLSHKESPNVIMSLQF